MILSTRARRAGTDGPYQFEVLRRAGTALRLGSGGGLAFCGVLNTSNDAGGHGFESEWLHGIGSPAFGQGPNGSSVTEHFRERHLGVQDCRTVFGFDADNAATAAVEIAEQIALIFFWCRDFDLHDRFEKNWIGLFSGIFERKNAGHFEGQLA